MANINILLFNINYKIFKNFKYILYNLHLYKIKKVNSKNIINLNIKILVYINKI